MCYLNPSLGWGRFARDCVCVCVCVSVSVSVSVSVPVPVPVSVRACVSAGFVGQAMKFLKKTRSSAGSPIVVCVCSLLCVLARVCAR